MNKDSVLDLANYSALLYMILQEKETEKANSNWTLRGCRPEAC